jgi:outer membrane protein assembly factor BamA
LCHVERQLLFKPGDPLSVRVLEETERLLRRNRYLYDVHFRVLAWHEGIVDIEVMTRDTWTLDLGASASRTGGANSSGIHLREYNLLGTCAAVRLGRSDGVDRSSNEFEFFTDHTFGTPVALSYQPVSTCGRAFASFNPRRCATCAARSFALHRWRYATRRCGCRLC